MEKIIRFSPAYDKRNSDPSKNYGIHGVGLFFVLKGELGATSFVVYTNWHLPEVQEELNNKPRYSVETLLPMPADFGYHSFKPLYEWQTHPTNDECEWLDGEPCYCDGSALYSEKVYERLLREGDSAVWKELEENYIERFGELR